MPFLSVSTTSAVLAPWVKPFRKSQRRARLQGGSERWERGGGGQRVDGISEAATMRRET